jgi:hypothetical protein
MNGSGETTRPFGKVKILSRTEASSEPDAVLILVAWQCRWLAWELVCVSMVASGQRREAASGGGPGTDAIQNRQRVLPGPSAGSLAKPKTVAGRIW